MALISNGTTIASGGSLSVCVTPPTSLNAVGTYALLTVTNSYDWAGHSAGGTYSGSGLQYINCRGQYGSGTPSGTWRFMGKITDQVGTNEGATTVMVRIS